MCLHRWMLQDKMLCCFNYCQSSQHTASVSKHLHIFWHDHVDQGSLHRDSKLSFTEQHLLLYYQALKNSFGRLKYEGDYGFSHVSLFILNIFLRQFQHSNGGSSCCQHSWKNRLKYICVLSELQNLCSLHVYFPLWCLIFFLLFPILSCFKYERCFGFKKNPQWRFNVHNFQMTKKHLIMGQLVLSLLFLCIYLAIYSHHLLIDIHLVHTIMSSPVLKLLVV